MRDESFSAYGGQPPASRRVEWLCRRVAVLAILPELLILLSPIKLPLVQKKPKSPSTKQLAVSRSPAVIKVTVRDVIVDIVVTDSQGKPVAGLSKSDFKVLEDSKPQKIVSFAAHEWPRFPRSALPEFRKLPPNTFTNFDPLPSDAPLNVILLDVGNTPSDDLPYVRHEICKYLRAQPLNARYAVFLMGSGMVSMIQGFTDDRNKLIAAIDNRKRSSLHFVPSVNPFTVYAQAAHVERQAELPASPSLTSTGPTGNAPGGKRWTQPLGGPSPSMRAAEEEFANKVQVGDTASEFAQLATFLGGLPGRKNLLWFTGSFPLAYQNLLQVAANFRQHPHRMALTGLVDFNNARKIDLLSELLERSRTAIYAIDAHGLQVYAPASEQYAEQSTLDVFAQETGGRAFYNTNGFEQAMASAINEGENYYTLTYSPSNTNFNGNLRHVRVELRLNPNHYHLAYRHTYFADASDATREPAPPPFAFTLQHGAPTSHQLLFGATLEPLGKPRTAKPGEIKPEPGAENAQALRVRSNAGPVKVQPYAVRLVLVPQQIAAVSASEGNRRIKLEFVVRGYNRSGRAIWYSLETAQRTFTPVSYLKIQKAGFRIHRQIVVPVKAKYLRLAVRDALSNRVGSLEVSLPLKQ